MHTKKPELARTESDFCRLCLKYRYVLILIVILILIIAIRLKNDLRVFYSDQVAIDKWVVVTELPDQNASKQWIKFDDLNVELSLGDRFSVGDVLRIKGKAECRSGSYNDRVRRRFDCQLVMIQPAIIQVQNHEAPLKFRLLSVIAELRQTWQELYRRVLPEPQAALVAGMTFGWKLKVQNSFYQNLVTTGTLHVVAASGQNLTILAQMLLIVFIRFVSRGKAIGLLIASVAGYTVLSGMSPSIVRAAIMATLSFVALSLGRQQDGLVGLWVAVAVMLMVKPLLVLDVGWQLSVAATAGLLLAQNSKLKVKSFELEELKVVLAAQVATLPILLVTFARLSLISPLVNLMIAPLVPIIMVGGGLIVVLGSVWIGLAQVVAGLVWVPATVLVKIIELFGQMPLAAVEVKGLPWWWAVGYYLVLLALVTRHR